MSVDKIKRYKENRIFRPCDIIIYALIAAVVFAMFLVVYFMNKESGEIKGLQIKYKNEVIARFLYSDCELHQSKGYENMTSLTNSDEGYTIAIKVTENAENILFIRKDFSLAEMLRANCSSDKDCTYMRIKNPLDSIVCIPHDLVIDAITDEFYVPDVIV